MTTVEKTIYFEGRNPVSNGALPNAPSWVPQLGLLPGRWAPFTLNVLADIDPEKDAQVNPRYPSSAPWRGSSGQRGVCSLWNGAAVAKPGVSLSHGGLLLHGGGHAGYYGTEMYALDMATRLFRRLSDPYNTALSSSPYPDGFYPDGSPVQRHLYDAVGYVPGIDSYYRLGCVNDGYPPSGNAGVGVNRFALFNVGTRQWRKGAYAPAAAGLGLGTGMASCVDETRGRIFFIDQNSSKLCSLYDLDVQNADGSYGKYQVHLALSSISGYAAGIDGGMCFDHATKLIIFANYRNGSSTRDVRCFDTTDLNNVTYFKPTLSSGGPVTDQAPGWEISDARHAVIYLADNAIADVWELAIPANPRTQTWVWTKLTAAANSFTPVAPDYSNGLYSKFNLLKYADMELAVMVTKVEDPGFVFRIT